MLRNRLFFQHFLLYLLLICTFYAIICYLCRNGAEFLTKRYNAQPYSLYTCPIQRCSHVVGVKKGIKKFNGSNIKRFLVICSTGSFRHKSIISFLNYVKVPIRIGTVDDLSILSIADISRFSVIIFESYHTYNLLSIEKKEKLLKFCAENNIGIISFLAYDEAKTEVSQQQFNLKVNQNIASLTFLDNVVNFVAKAGCSFALDSLNSGWTFFGSVNSSSYSTILYATDPYYNDYAVEVLLQELYNVQHIILGQHIDNWIIKIAFLDALSYVAPNVVDYDLNRYVQVDIDDVFVGQSGTKISSADVYRLIEVQHDLRNYIENFTFFLGFSGYFFRHGDAADIKGDEALVAKASNFRWFPHMWKHNHVHEYSDASLKTLMIQNQLFANNTFLKYDMEYAVSPQHSSVYPISDLLYDAWKEVWGVTVTSTEEYPHFRPASSRRGFIFKNLSVLPRQTCGLFTHTYYFHAYPNAIAELYDLIFGGDLFTTLLMNKYSIFMTHQQNYGNDRLALFVFQNLVRFVHCWTNLKLKSVEPSKLAQLYFASFPEEKQLVYTNPCSDPRHMKILPLGFNCSGFTLPNVIILGPQKTGTSALSLFISLHPDVATNKPIDAYFEELQFFGQNYGKGVGWYTDKFAASHGKRIIFEKSANYFDNANAPRLMHSLLSDIHLIVILLDPVDRAYSWYQHMRSHNDSVAVKYDAEQVFMSNISETSRLRSRCLVPGMYATHLDRWLDYYPPSSLTLLDGKQLRDDPATVFEKLIKRWNLSNNDETMMNISRRIKYIPEKRFFCAINQKKKLNCLGPSKGRKYDAMSAKLRLYLNAFYAKHNADLQKMLKRYNFPLPYFLEI